VDEFPAGHALGTELSFIYRAALVGCDPNELPIPDDKVQATTNTTIRASCMNVLNLGDITQTQILILQFFYTAKNQYRPITIYI
jgi:hypothetical protein